MAYIGIDPNVGDISFQQFTGDGSTTAFTLAQNVASGEAIIVTIGNVVQEPGASAAYTAYGNTLTFSAAPVNGDVITVRYFGRAIDQPLSYAMQLFKYVATASQTVFTGADNAGAILAFSGNDVDVYLNGVHLDTSDYTPSNGDTITLATGATLNDELVIRAYRAFTVTDTVSKASGGTFNGGITIDSDTAALTVKAFQPKITLDDDSAVGAGSDKLIIQSVAGQSDGDYEFVINNDQTSSADQTALRLYGNGDISFFEDTGTNRRFFWDASAESLGIGTTSPQGALDLGNATAGTGIVWGGTAGTNHYSSIWTEYGTGSIVIGAGLKASTNSSDFIYPFTGTYGYAAIELDSFSDDGIKFYTAADGSRTAGTTATKNERMRLDTSGNLLVGTTSNPMPFAAQKITLDTGSGTYNGLGVSQLGNGFIAYATRPSAAHNYFAGYFLNSSGSPIGNILVGTSSTSYNTSSDYRLKTNVTYDWDATSRLKQLKPARFEWISDGDDAVPVDGFLADEVENIVPEAITGTKDAVDDEGNPVYQGIDQSKLTPLLTKALIEAVEKIEQLEARIAALESA